MVWALGLVVVMVAGFLLLVEAGFLLLMEGGGSLAPEHRWCMCVCGGVANVREVPRP